MRANIMRNILLSFLVGILSLGLLMTDAHAKRFGGGKSFGHSRSFSSTNKATNASRVQTPAKPASTGNKWLAPIAGLAIGGLIASLFMGHGLGTGILSWLMIAGVIFILWRLISRFRLPNRSMQHAAYQTAEPLRVMPETAPLKASLQDTSYTSEQNNFNEFDEVNFLRHAKTIYIRLQTAYDTKNLNDLREYTTPEVYAEIQIQCQERGDDVNQTDVITIDALLLDLAVESEEETASVLFSGLIREQPESEPLPVKEIWHFNKNKNKDEWVVAGIQQEA